VNKLLIFYAHFLESYLKNKINAVGNELFDKELMKIYKYINIRPPCLRVNYPYNKTS